MGISAAKSRISRATGIPLTRSGRQRKIGKMVTGGGCALVTLSLLAALLVPAGAMATARLYSFKSSVSNHYPKQYTYVTVRAYCKDSAGHPISGVKVKSTWKYKTTTSYAYGTTNSLGVASMKRYISSASKGYKVVIVSSASSGGVSKTTSQWFTPQ